MVSRNYEVGASSVGPDGPGTPSGGVPAPRAGPSSLASELVRHGRFQYLGDRPLEVTDSLKGYRPRRRVGSSTDTIYRTENDSPSDWWKDNERGWRIFRWSLVLLAILLVLGLVIYFLMIDMQVMAPVLTKTKESHEGKIQDGRLITESLGAITDDVVPLDGNAILNPGDVTYHQGQFHDMPGQAVPYTPPAITDFNSNNDSSHPDYIEIVPAPNLETPTMSDETDIYEHTAATQTSEEESTDSYPTTVNVGEIYNNTATTYPSNGISPEFLYATSQLLNKIRATTQQNSEISNSQETDIIFEQIRKQTVPSKTNKNKQVYVRPPARTPVFPTVPPSSTTHHMETYAGELHNESEGLCFSPRLPMCRGVLPYDLTTLPLVPGVTRLADLDAALPYFEMILESGCSARARQFICSLLEPECQPMGDNLILPCRKACKAVAEECSDFILATLDLSRVFQCELYPNFDDVTQCVNFARGKSCMQDEFHCPDGTCIPSRWQCDNINDCPLAADEVNCTHCKKDEFRCEIEHKCIPLRWKCDGQRDCRDSSDEYNCPVREGCSPGLFQCEDQSACISTKWLCDGSTQCPDGSDERNCSEKECQSEDFRCRQTGQCIPASWRCNGVNDCADNSDEDHCTVITSAPRLTAMPHTSPCPSGELRCLDGRCITLQQLCDGKRDCTDGADEANCGVGV